MPNIAAEIKLVFSLGNLSWSEVYYYSSDTQPISQAIVDARKLAGWRRKWLSSSASLNAVHISQIQFDGLGYVMPNVLRQEPVVRVLTDNLGPGIVSGTQSKYSQMILWRLTSLPSGIKRSVQSRGAPTAYWAYKAASPYAPAIYPDLLTNSEAWQAFLDRRPGASDLPLGNFCIKAVSRDPDANPKKQVLTVTSADPQGAPWILTLDTPLVFSEPGDQIKVGGFRGPWSRGLNRVGTIKTIVGNVVTLVQNKGNDCPINYTSGGYVREQVYTLYPITTCEFVRYVVRDTGVTTMAPKGRNRNNPRNSRYR